VGNLIKIRRAETQKSLADAGCDTPGCMHDHSMLFPYQKCHPDDGFVAKYEKVTGILTLDCIVCGRTVVKFRVAAE
jgi:hypothetical protein